ncbi:hypothetical protein M8J76_014702 [Diaphorina citri]|nr:hypothetical protein M8J76_014702 [Diaphorina citri]
MSNSNQCCQTYGNSPPLYDEPVTWVLKNQILKKRKYLFKVYAIKTKCLVCERKSTQCKAKVCIDCVQFFEALKNNVTQVSCTQDIRCFQYTPSNFCPLHKFIKCQIYLERKNSRKSKKSPSSHNSSHGNDSMEEETNFYIVIKQKDSSHPSNSSQDDASNASDHASITSEGHPSAHPNNACVHSNASPHPSNASAHPSNASAHPSNASEDHASNASDHPSNTSANASQDHASQEQHTMSSMYAFTKIEQQGNHKIKCAVCLANRVASVWNNEVCNKCYQFYLTIQTNSLPLSCRNDTSCVKFSPSKYCPLHKYQKCVQIIANDFDQNKSETSIEQNIAPSSNNMIKEVEDIRNDTESLQSSDINEHQRTEEKEINQDNDLTVHRKDESEVVICEVCQMMVVLVDQKVCSQCYKFYNIIESNRIAVSCTKDARCLRMSVSQYCPLHRFETCRKLILNDERKTISPTNVNYEVRVVLENLKLSEFPAAKGRTQKGNFEISQEMKTDGCSLNNNICCENKRNFLNQMNLRERRSSCSPREQTTPKYELRSGVSKILKSDPTHQGSLDRIVKIFKLRTTHDGLSFEGPSHEDFTAQTVESIVDEKSHLNRTRSSEKCERSYTSESAGEVEKTTNCNSPKPIQNTTLTVMRQSKKIDASKVETNLEAATNTRHLKEIHSSSVPELVETTTIQQTKDLQNLVSDVFADSATEELEATKNINSPIDSHSQIPETNKGDNSIVDSKISGGEQNESLNSGKMQITKSEEVDKNIEGRTRREVQNDNGNSNDVPDTTTRVLKEIIETNCNPDLVPDSTSPDKVIKDLKNRTRNSNKMSNLNLDTSLEKGLNSNIKETKKSRESNVGSEMSKKEKIANDNKKRETSAKLTREPEPLKKKVKETDKVKCSPKVKELNMNSRNIKFVNIFEGVEEESNCKLTQKSVKRMPKDKSSPLVVRPTFKHRFDKEKHRRVSDDKLDNCELIRDNLKLKDDVRKIGKSIDRDKIMQDELKGNPSVCGKRKLQDIEPPSKSTDINCSNTQKRKSTGSIKPDTSKSSPKRKRRLSEEVKSSNEKKYSNKEHDSVKCQMSKKYPEKKSNTHEKRGKTTSTRDGQMNQSVEGQLLKKNIENIIQKWNTRTVENEVVREPISKSSTENNEQMSDISTIEVSTKDVLTTSKSPDPTPCVEVSTPTDSSDIAPDPAPYVEVSTPTTSGKSSDPTPFVADTTPTTSSCKSLDPAPCVEVSTPTTTSDISSDPAPCVEVSTPTTSSCKSTDPAPCVEVSSPTATSDISDPAPCVKVSTPTESSDKAPDPTPCVEVSTPTTSDISPDPTSFVEVSTPTTSDISPDPTPCVEVSTPTTSSDIAPNHAPYVEVSTPTASSDLSPDPAPCVEVSTPTTSSCKSPDPAPCAEVSTPTTSGKPLDPVPCVEDSTKYVSSSNKSPEPAKKSGVILDFVANDELDFDEDLKDQDTPSEKNSQSSNLDIGSNNVTSSMNETNEPSRRSPTPGNDKSPIEKNIQMPHQTNEFQSDSSPMKTKESVSRSGPRKTFSKDCNEINIRPADSSVISNENSNGVKTFESESRPSTLQNVENEAKKVRRENQKEKTGTDNVIPTSESRENRLRTMEPSCGMNLNNCPPLDRNVNSKTVNNKEVFDFSTDNILLVKQEVASQLRSSYQSLLDFICTVSCERRWPYINRLFTNNSLNVMRMAVACYALQWNGTYKFSQLLNLLQTLLGERYKTLVTSVTRLVIVLANDEVFDNMILEFAMKCAKTILISRQKRQWYYTSKILPRVVHETGLYFEAFKIMVEEEMEIRTPFVVNTMHQVLVKRDKVDCDYFVKTVLKMYPNGSHVTLFPQKNHLDLLTKLKNYRSKRYTDWLRTMPSFIVRLHLNEEPSTNSIVSISKHVESGVRSLQHTVVEENDLSKKDRGGTISENRNVRTSNHVESQDKGGRSEHFVNNTATQMATSNDYQPDYSNSSDKSSNHCSSNLCNTDCVRSSNINDSGNVAIQVQQPSGSGISSTKSFPTLEEAVSFSVSCNRSTSGIFGKTSTQEVSSKPVSPEVLDKTSPSGVFGKTTTPEVFGKSNLGFFGKNSIAEIFGTSSVPKELGKSTSNGKTSTSEVLDKSTSNDRNSTSQVLERSTSRLFGRTSTSEVLDKSTSNDENSTSQVLDKSTSNFENSTSQVLERSTSRLFGRTSTSEVLDKSTSNDENSTSQVLDKSTSNPENSTSQVLETRLFGRTSTSEVLDKSTSNDENSRPQVLDKSTSNDENSTSQVLERSTSRLFGRISTSEVLDKSTSNDENSRPQILDKLTSTLYGHSTTPEVFGKSNLGFFGKKSAPEIFGKTSTSEAVDKSTSGILGQTSSPGILNKTSSPPVLGTTFSEWLGNSTSGVFGKYTQEEFSNISAEFWKMTNTFKSSPTRDSTVERTTGPFGQNIFQTQSPDQEVIRCNSSVDSRSSQWDPTTANCSQDDDIEVLDVVVPSPKIVSVIDIDSDDSNGVPESFNTRGNEPGVNNVSQESITNRSNNNQGSQTESTNEQRKRRISFNNTPDIREIQRIVYEDSGEEEDNLTTRNKRMRQEENVLDSMNEPRTRIEAPSVHHSDAVANFISSLREYTYLSKTDKMSFIRQFYSSERQSVEVLRNLYEVVLNKVIDPGSVTTNVDYEHVTELTKFNVDAFIKTPVICKDKWSPLKIWLFLSQFQKRSEAVSVLQKYSLLEEDLTKWRLNWQESDLEQYCQVVTLLLNTYREDKYVSLNMCRTLLFLHKIKAYSTTDFPQVLQKILLMILDEYFYISNGYYDTYNEYYHLGDQLFPVISSTLELGARRLALSTSDIIELRDIYSIEEMSLHLTYALANISSDLFNRLKTNQTVVKIFLKKYSQFSAGRAFQEQLAKDLPNLSEMIDPSIESARSRALTVLESRLSDSVGIQLSDEQPADCDDMLYLDTLSTIAYIHTIQNKELVKP